MNDLQSYSDFIFENIKHIDENGNEYWLARELQSILDYSRWENFEKAIKRARKACQNTGYETEYHFREVTKMVEIGSGSERVISDFELSRYACYLIVMNSDPNKDVIALGQTYFAIQTHRQELVDNYEELSEDQKRLDIRNEMKRHNIALADAAHDAGVTESKDYAIFQNYGYMGLYGGLKAQDIRDRKGLRKNQNILDHMGSTELAANLFRATQTEEKLRRENIKGKVLANNAHYSVGKKVRQTIKDLGGTMPEDLPTPAESISQLEKKQRRIQGPSKKASKDSDK